MATPIATIESHHEDMIHDSQFDYYAKKLATCSSDRTIRIYEVSAGDAYLPVATLNAHDGPIWQVAWAHPRFGSLIASCSYDGSVIVHREVSQNTWSKIYEHRVHDSSVNSICWAPHEYGLILACASSDGKISILEYKNDTWIHMVFVNDTLGSNSVSWSPFSTVSSADGSSLPLLRLVTGSCDNTVRVWRFEGSWENSMSGEWTEERRASSAGHSDWVRDVAWAPSTSSPHSIIASCSEDRTVRIWRQAERDGPWSAAVVRTFPSPVWRVSWSVTGSVLAVSTADHKVSLWKQCVDETWMQISTLDDEANSN